MAILGKKKIIFIHIEIIHTCMYNYTVHVEYNENLFKEYIGE